MNNGKIQKKTEAKSSASLGMSMEIVQKLLKENGKNSLKREMALN